jgi:ABC-type transport system involved in multi-copper enzyme maturation permease subunit
MKRGLIVARREATEILRQGWNLAVVACLLGIIALCADTAIWLLNMIAVDPPMKANFEGWMVALGIGGSTTDVVTWLVRLANFLMFTQYLGFSAVLAGHTMIHDRHVHALPFLLLAPISRFELLLGKVVGAVFWPTVVYLTTHTAALLVAAWFPVTASVAGDLPIQAAWWLAVWVGSPIWVVGVGLICATWSAVSDDVRGAQQGVWFVMFFFTLVAGFLLSGRMADGAVVQLGVAGLGAAVAAGAAWAGSLVLGRELGR